MGAFIYTKDGKVFAGYERPNNGRALVPPPYQRSGHDFGRQELTLFDPIDNKGDAVGAVYIVLDMGALYSRLREYAVIALVVFLITLLTAYLLSARLQRLISKPILDLVQTTRAVARDRNYTLRAVKQNQDEIGVLIDGFNEMLTQIQERDGALQKTHGELEQRVNERTQELAGSLSLLHATLESTADGILVTDLYGKVTQVNERFAAMWRIPRELLDTRDDQHILETVMVQLKYPRQFLAGVKELNGDPDREGVELLEFKDGRIFERHSKPQRIGENSVGRVWSYRDITERKQAEIYAVAFSKLGRDLVTATTPQEAARSIAGIADELFAWDACAFYSYFQETDEIHPVLYMDLVDGRRTDVLSPDVAKPSVISRRVI
ncbi:MAG: Signal transduction histidine kinase CheA, partial [Pedosphaera sp.]|nr:Signal transduction histidine kinase CheA [Pedosphaera sp.]